MSEPSEGQRTEERGQLLLLVLVSVAGAVAGTLAVVLAFHVDDKRGALLAAVIGAAIPPAIAVVVPIPRIPLLAGVFVFAAAIGLTYTGLTAAQRALGDDTTYPFPGEPESPGPTATQAAQTPSTTTTSPTGTSTSTTPSSRTVCGSDKCIRWSPTRLQCWSKACTPAVTVSNAGSESLTISGLRFTGTARSRLDTDRNSCLGRILDSGESCTITVGVSPGAPGAAQLRIQQNLPADKSSVVDISVAELAAPPSDVDLAVSASDLRCSVVPGDPDQLTFFVRVVKTGELTQPVPFRISSDTGRSRSGRTAVGDPLTGLRLPLLRGDYDAAHVYTLTLDPDDTIREFDESNNAVAVTMPAVDPPVTPSDVPCWTG